MYVCMYVCILCMCTSAVYLLNLICMHACMYVCMYICMYTSAVYLLNLICMYVCMHVYMNITRFTITAPAVIPLTRLHMHEWPFSLNMPTLKYTHKHLQDLHCIVGKEKVQHKWSFLNNSVGVLVVPRAVKTENLAIVGEIFCHERLLVLTPAVCVCVCVWVK